MAEQQQMSKLVTRFGARVAALNTEMRDKPVDTGNMRLPPGIRDGVAKLVKMTIEQTTEEKERVPRGTLQLKAAAVAMTPESHNGAKVSGVQFFKTVSLCDIPAKGQSKAVSFDDNYDTFQNTFKLLGIDAPRGPQYEVTPNMSEEQAEAAGMRVISYYKSAATALTSPKHPIYFKFSTRAWTPPATIEKPKPEEMVFEYWHEKIDLISANGQHDPAAAVTVNAPVPSAPPSAQSMFNEFAPPPPQTTQTAPMQFVEAQDEADEAYNVGVLVQTAMDDPDGATDDGTYAISQLEAKAQAMGWTKEQITNAEDWAVVGDMCLNPPEHKNDGAAAAKVVAPVVDSVWMFAKRNKDGARMKNSQGQEFPPKEVRVVLVDEAAATCQLVYAKDNKPVVDMRTKEPVDARFEWLEPV